MPELRDLGLNKDSLPMDAGLWHGGQLVREPATDQAIGLLKERVPTLDASAFDQYPLHLYRGVVSTQAVDTYWTCMADSSLKNYAKDASDGVAFLVGHDTRQMPTGYSLKGEYRGGDIPEVSVLFYTAQGMDPAVDGFLNRVRLGLLRDLSIGFKLVESYRCSVCNLDLFNPECRHVPGEQYAPEKGRSKKAVHAFAWVEGARLSEVSGVYDGSTPNATLVKLYRMASEGDINARAVDHWEQTYGVRMPHPPTAHRVPEVPEPEPTPPADEPSTQEQGTMELENAIRELLARHEVPVGTDLVAKLDQLLVDLKDSRSTVATAQADLANLKALAEDGRAYRDATIDQAVKEAVRAEGAEADAKYRAVFAAMPLDTIRTMASGFKTIADSKLGAGTQQVGGRTTQDAPTQTRSDEAVDMPPATAWAH